MVEILVGKACRLHPVEEPLQTGTDAVASCMQPIVGVAPEEVIELDQMLMETLAKVELGHAQLILVGEEDALSYALLCCSHGALLLP